MVQKLKGRNVAETINALSEPKIRSEVIKFLKNSGIDKDARQRLMSALTKEVKYEMGYEVLPGRKITPTQMKYILDTEMQEMVAMIVATAAKKLGELKDIIPEIKEFALAMGFTSFSNIEKDCKKKGGIIAAILLGGMFIRRTSVQGKTVNIIDYVSSTDRWTEEDRVEFALDNISNMKNLQYKDEVYVIDMRSVKLNKIENINDII
jgi:hypothetical protein